MMQDIPFTTFYFIRHGQTDWNKYKNVLCDQDDIPLNTMGIEQAIKLRDIVQNLPIKRVYSSPLERAKQTAFLVFNNGSELNVQLHQGLGNIDRNIITYTFAEILSNQELTLVVSHGEVYRLLLDLLSIKTSLVMPKNGGLYCFKASSGEWQVKDLTP